MNEWNTWHEPFYKHAHHYLTHLAKRKSRTHVLPTTLPEWKKKKGKLRKLIWDNAGSKPDHQLKLNFEVTGVIKRKEYQIQKIIFQSRKNYYVTGNLYIPNKKGVYPGILNVHGHCSDGRLNEGIQLRAHILALSGYVCLSTDTIGSGERSTHHGEFEHHGIHLGASLMEVGQTLLGMQLVDNMRAIDLLQSLPFVDSNKIGVTGESGGGAQTMWVSAMDDRVKASIPVVSVGSFEKYIMGSNCHCEVLPEGLNFFEESGLLSLIAPRALMILNANRDFNPTFSPLEMARSFESAKKTYRLFQSEENIQHHVLNGVHGYSKNAREIMLGWFDHHFKNKANWTPSEEPDCEFASQSQLMCFPLKKRSKKIVPIAEFLKQQGQNLRKENWELGTINLIKIQKNLKQSLKIERKYELDFCHQHTSTNISKHIWERVTLESKCGRLIPILYKPAKNKAKTWLLLHSHGKDAITKTSFFKKLQKQDEGILIMDHLGTGEVFHLDYPGVQRYHDLSRACLWLGKTLLGEWVKEVCLLTETLKRNLNINIHGCYGYQDAGLISLFSQVIQPTFKTLYLDETPLSLLFRTKELTCSLGNHLPNILSTGDIIRIVSVCPANIDWKQPTHIDQKTMTAKELKSLQTILQKLKPKSSKWNYRFN